MMYEEKSSLERAKRMRVMSLVWIGLAGVFSGAGYCWLSPQTAEPFYMVSGVFLAMALVSYAMSPR